MNSTVERTNIMNAGRHKIKKGFKDLRLDLDAEGTHLWHKLNELEKLVIEEQDRLIRALQLRELVNVKVAPPEKRHVRMDVVSSQASKITFRPSNGEILVKSSKHNLERNNNLLLALAERVKNEIPEDVKQTLRGTCKWSESQQNFKVILRSNHSKAYAFAFNIVDHNEG